MKQFFGLLTVIVLSSFVSGETISSYKVDTQASVITWKGYKVAGSHEGTIKVKNGTLEYTDGLLSGGTFEIDMNSMTVTDLKGGSAEKLLGHLKSEDFFGVEKYPTTTFKINNVVPQGPNRYKISGDITIKKTTKTIKFIATTTDDANGMTAKADIKIDRSDFNVKYGSGSFFSNLGDKTIYDEFDLSVSLVVKK